MKSRILMAVLAILTMIAGIDCEPAAARKLTGSDINAQWKLSGGAALGNDDIMLTGAGSSAVLQKSDYTDFILNTEVMISGGAVGEILFHTDKKRSKGYAVALDNDHGKEVWWRKTGSLVSVRNLAKSFLRDGEWFRLTVAVVGDYIRVEINGEPVVEYLEPAQPYRTKENSQRRLSAGTFAIVNNSGGEIRFRDMTVEVPRYGEQPPFERFVTEAVDEQTDEIIRLHQDDFPVLDYHVHLKGGLTKERAAIQSRQTGINYAIAPNCGKGFMLTTDEEVLDYLDLMRSQPFILAMQAEGREWVDTFSPEVRAQFDYVFTDALTFNDSQGRRTLLWIPESTHIDDEQEYMELILDMICSVLEEPADVYVNPCFLPSPMDERYDHFWTEERMNRFVDALAKSGKALEINELYNIPSKAIIMKAKEAGVKFTFGSNNVVPEVTGLQYSLRMMKECGLKASDMYKPKLNL